MIRPDSYPQSESPSGDHQFGSYKDETAVGANDGTGLFKDQIMDLFQPWANLFTKHSITPSNVKEKSSASQVTEALDAELTLTAGNVDTMSANGTYTVEFDNKNGILILESPLTIVTLAGGSGIDDGSRLTVLNNTGGTITLNPGSITLLDTERMLLFYNSDITAFDSLLGDNVIAGTIRNTITTDSSSKDTGSVILEGGIGVEKKIHAGLEITSDVGTKRGTAGIVFREKEIDIGDWDMDANTSVSVAHGIGADYKKIRNISVIIRHDDDNEYYDLNRFDDGADPGLLGGGVLSIGSTNIVIKRRAGGAFDNVSFDSTSYNRGWIYILYKI